LRGPSCQFLKKTALAALDRFMEVAKPVMTTSSKAAADSINETVSGEEEVTFMS
jgi:hypothetical protein